MPLLETNVLMITYDRAEYTQISLKSLLDSCDESMGIWIWHNGSDSRTLDVVRSFADHKSVQQVFYSEDNRKLTVPTNWMWSQAKGKYLGKVDDDCLVPTGWAQTLANAHKAVPELGVLSCWRFLQEDFDYELARPKIRNWQSGHQVLQNFWTGGSGYLLKRECIDRCGYLTSRESFTDYCIRLAKNGWVNGWYYPLVLMDHMDDPRSPNTRLKTDSDLRSHLPLSASLYEGEATTLASWEAGQRRSAQLVQMASIKRQDYTVWRGILRKIARRLTYNSGR